MKISSASKKVLASALSAAMVVAFAPTVALAADNTLTDDQAKALGYTVKATTVATSSGNSVLNTVYYKDLADAFDQNSGVKLALTLMADQDGAFATDATAEDTISIDTNGFKITNSKDEGDAPLTVSANDTVTVTGTGSIEQVKGDGADGSAAGVKAVAGNGSAVLKGVTVTTASKKTPAVTTATTELEGASIEGAVEGVTKVKGGTYGTIKAKSSTVIDVSGTVASKGIEGSVKAYAGADLSVEATNSKDGKSVTGISGDVEFATLSTGKTASVKVSAINTGSTADGALDAVTADSEFDENATYVTLAGSTPTKYQISDSDVTSSNFDAATMATAEVYAFTAGKSADATAISGTVKGIAEGVTLEATARATGYDASEAVKGIVTSGDIKNIDPTTNATAVGGYATTASSDTTVPVAIEKGALTASAASVDGTATGVGSALTVKGGTVAVSAEGADADKSVAVSGALTASAGKYTGKYGSGSSFTGGSYSVKPGTGNYNSASYVVVDDGEFFNVEQAKNFKVAKTSAYNKNVAANSADDKAILAFAENLLQDISAGKAVSGIALAKDVKEADLVSKAVAGDLKIDYKVSAYNAKRATDEQKAAYEALKKYASDNLSLIESADNCTVAFYELSLGYNDKSGSYVKMADVKDLGTKVDGRDTVANTITLRSGDATKGTVISYSGSVAKMAYAVKDGKTQNYVETAAIPFATAFMTTDLNAVKDAAIKGGDTPAAAEKATQGIDVAKKSKTVKLAKKATKTKKAQSFSMGVSAETAVTTAKKSGSKYVTVKGGKVTLKKGAKKGTYTAKVSIKAAASDAYMAATKTVTVKFIVKK